MTVNVAHRLLPTVACRGAKCGEQIAWRTTVSGARIPLDPFPSDIGNVVVDGPEAKILGNPEVLEVREAGMPLYLPHHATCVNVKWFR